MAVNLVVAVTDDDWFEMLRRRVDLPEVNFWAPSGASFRALKPGELFLFKLHSPRNFIVGGGQRLGREAMRFREIARFKDGDEAVTRNVEGGHIGFRRSQRRRLGMQSDDVVVGRRRLRQLSAPPMHPPRPAC